MTKFTEWSDELIAALHETTPASAISEKKQGGATIKFTSDKYVQNRLDEVVGPDGWEDDYTITHYPAPFEQRGKLIVGSLVCRIKVLGRMKSAAADLVFEEKMYGSPATNAQAQAFKRAAMKFGIARELWDKDVPVADDNEEGDKKVPKFRKPAAKSTGGISAGQSEWLSKLGVPDAVIETLTRDDLGKNGKDLLGNLFEYADAHKVPRGKALSMVQLREVFEDLEIPFKVKRPVVVQTEDEDDGYSDDE